MHLACSLQQLPWVSIVLCAKSCHRCWRPDRYTSSTNKESHSIAYPPSERTLPRPTSSEVLRKIPSKKLSAKELPLSILNCWLQSGKTGVCCIHGLPRCSSQGKEGGVLWADFTGCLIMKLLSKREGLKPKIEEATGTSGSVSNSG